MKRFVKIMAAALVCVAFVGGASAKAAKKAKFSQEGFNQALADSDYSLCASMLESIKNSDVKNALDLAMLQHMTKDFASSTVNLNTASNLIDEAFTKSISREVGAAALNENIAEYSGNIYEYLLVNAFNALNYNNQGDFDEALVEIRKIAVKQNEYAKDYGTIALADTDGEMNEDFTNALGVVGLKSSDVTSFMPKKPTEADVYKDSAFVRYLGMVLNTMDGDENAEVDARYLASLNEKFAGAYKEETTVPEGQGRLDVVSLAGKINERQAGERILPLPMLATLFPSLILIELSPAHPNVFSMRYTFPEFQKDPSQSNGYAFSVESVTVGDKTFSLSELENFNEAVRKDVAVNARKAFTRSLVRSTVKKSAALAAGDATMKQTIDKLEGKPAMMVTKGIQAAGKGIEKGLAAIDDSEDPDVRQCAFLPAAAYAGGINLEPGSYTVTVKYSNGTSDVIENVEITAGKTKLVESVCLK